MYSSEKVPVTIRFLLAVHELSNFKKALLNVAVDFRGRHSPDTAGRAVSLLGAQILRGLTPSTTIKIVF
jgi:hypothetical protein